MAQLIGDLDPERVASQLAEAHAEIAAACARSGRQAGEVQLLVATKYVPIAQMGVLAEAGIELVGENRMQDLRAKQERWGERFTWDFIGVVQSRKVGEIMPRVRFIHSIASDSALRALARCAPMTPPGLGVLIEVNVAGEPGKAGIAPVELDAFIERCPVPVAGLMTMPPPARDAEASRRWFANLRELAGARGLPELSMGTTQDYRVAVEEGATIVRIGRALFE